jgi:hypothetical protein
VNGMEFDTPHGQSRGILGSSRGRTSQGFPWKAVDQLSPSVTLGVPQTPGPLGQNKCPKGSFCFSDEKPVVGAVWLPGGPPKEAITVATQHRHSFYPGAFPLEPPSYVLVKVLPLVYQMQAQRCWRIGQSLPPSAV